MCHSSLNIHMRCHTDTNHMSIRQMERSHIRVKNVAKPSITTNFVKTIREVIMEEKSINVKNVEKPSIFSRPL